MSELLHVNAIAAYKSAEKDSGWLTMTGAGTMLGVTNHTIRRLVKSGILPATQVVPGAPYQIYTSDLTSDQVKDAVARKHSPHQAKDENTIPMLTDTYRKAAQ